MNTKDRLRIRLDREYPDWRDSYQDEFLAYEALFGVVYGEKKPRDPIRELDFHEAHYDLIPPWDLEEE